MEIIKTANSGATIPETLTCFEELYLEGKKNYRLLFGRPAKTITKEYEFGRITRKHHFFNPGDIFAVDLWDRNEYGTTQWLVYVVQAATTKSDTYQVPQITPAVNILLEAIGAKQSRTALKLLKEIEDRTDPTRLPANRYLMTDFHLKSASRVLNTTLLYKNRFA